MNGHRENHSVPVSLVYLIRKKQNLVHGWSTLYVQFNSNLFQWRELSITRTNKENKKNKNTHRERKEKQQRKNLNGKELEKKVQL